jgi:tetratricopeptide (TPR) repeat protein
MLPSAGMRFSRYELLSRLGSGGMGEVWRARDHDLHRDVAVKFLPEKYAADPNRFGRFSQEALATSKLTHPNIVTIHEVGQTSGLHYIVMELVEGQTLREILLAQGEHPLPTRRLLEIGAQIAEGLAKAHAAGIVHRDLKPENVMVTSDGFVKVLDFGLAKLRSDSSAGQERWFDSSAPTWPESPSPQTAVGAVLGTAGYMSPEQARGRPVDYRSDQFTLGTILYEMAAGRQPFRRETPVQTIAAIIEDPAEPLATLNPSLPAPLRWVIERCLAKDPAERYASTLDLARELRGLRERLPEAGVSGSSAPTGVSRRAPRWLRLALFVAAGLAVALVVAIAVPSVRERLAVALSLRPLPSEKRLAVLPFRSISENPEDRSLAAGLGDLLTARLIELERFSAARLSVESASNVRQAEVTSASAAARELGVALVVTGSIHRDGGVRKFTAVLEDARDGRTLRACRAEGEEGLAQRIVEMLALELDPQGWRALRSTGTGVAEASTLASQGYSFMPFEAGRTALERYEQTANIERAIELFNEALERDPRYALAHAGLGQAYWRLYQNGKQLEHARLAESHTRRAIELDDLYASGWTTLGIIHTGTGRPEEALLDFQKALDRDPRSADALRERGYALERLVRFEEAEASYRRAVEIRPELWSSWNYLGTFYMDQNRFSDAEAAYRRALELAPDNVRALSNLGAAIYYQDRAREAEEVWKRAVQLQAYPGAARNLASLQFSERRYTEAVRTLEQAVASAVGDYTLWRSLGAARYWAPGQRPRAAEAYRRAAELAEQEHRVDPTNARVIAHLADCRAMLGEGDKARLLAEEAARLAPDSRRVAEILSGVYGQIGDRNDALRWLTRAVEDGYPLADVESDPTFEKLRKDPRFAGVVAAAAGRH